jgi:hypothetical protein
VNTVASPGQDKTVRHVLEGLEVLAAELPENVADNLFAPTFDLIGFVNFVGKLIADRHSDDTLDLILQSSEGLASHLLLSNRPTACGEIVSRY